METLNQAHPDTNAVTNNLKTASVAQPFASSSDDVETEDSNSNTQNSTEDSVEEDNKSEHTNQAPDSKVEVNTISSVRLIHDISPPPKDVLSTRLEDLPMDRCEEEINFPDTKQDIDCVGNRIQTEEDDKTQTELFQPPEGEEDYEEKLLKSDEDEKDSTGDRNERDVTDELSMEEEDELLKSEEEDEKNVDVEDEQQFRKILQNEYNTENSHKDTEVFDNNSCSPIRDRNEATDIQNKLVESQEEHQNDCKDRRTPIAFNNDDGSTSHISDIESKTSGTMIVAAESQQPNSEKEISTSDVTGERYASKLDSSFENESDNSSSSSSSSSAINSPIYDKDESNSDSELSCSSGQQSDNGDDSDGEPDNRAFISASQHSISETADIKDVGPDVGLRNSSPQDEEKGNHLPTSTQLVSIAQNFDTDPDQQNSTQWAKDANCNAYENSLSCEQTDLKTMARATPKINGDHKQQKSLCDNEESNNSGTSEANTTKSANTSQDSAQLDNLSMSSLPLPYCNEANTPFSSENNLADHSDAHNKQQQDEGEPVIHPSDTPTKVDSKTLAVKNAIEALAVNMDEASRSSVASFATNESTTSSTHQLVIDHVMEEAREEKIQPLKISLKRKLSYSSDDNSSEEPLFKKQQFNNKDGESVAHPVEQNQSVELMRSNIASPQHTQQAECGQRFSDAPPNRSSSHRDLNVNIPEGMQFSIKQEKDETAPAVFKSLLLQQLEKPIMAPTMQMSQFAVPAAIRYDAADTSVQPQVSPHNNMANSANAELTEMPPPPPGKPSSTKYLCFKCKSGSFDSMARLKEHQSICLRPQGFFPLATKTGVTSNPKPASQALDAKSPPALQMLKHKNTTAPANAPKKRYYKCSSCNTYHENWNLFLHIREKHNRYTCLYCVRFFPTAEKLALHLEIKHDLEQIHFNSEDALRQSVPEVESQPLESRYLMCCTCEHVFMEREPFSQHDCAEFIKPCSLCGQKGRHSSQCKAHPDSKRFSKLKKKKDKLPSPVKQYNNERLPTDTQVPLLPEFVANHLAVDPTKIPNSNSSCDNGRAVINARLQNNALHNDDSNSSSNMVIDESCNSIHQTSSTIHSDMQWSVEEQSPRESNSKSSLAPDRPPAEDEVIKSPLPSLKLVVPKFKLRVPKEFQKSVNETLSTSESDDVEEEDAEGEEQDSASVDDEDRTAFIREDQPEARQDTLIADTTPASSQDRELERNSATESATEAGNSQDDAAYESDSIRKVQNCVVSLDEDDSLDEPNSNLVRIMQEIERTKMDIKRTKKTSFRHNKPITGSRPATLSQSSSRTADRNWSPTPPASPNSRWFTPRRATTSQCDESQKQSLPLSQYGNSQQQHHSNAELPPEIPQQDGQSPIGAQGIEQRRDTVGSDIMDIDESISSQPTQTIYRDESQAEATSEQLDTTTETVGDEAMETSQTTDNGEDSCSQEKDAEKSTTPEAERIEAETTNVGIEDEMRNENSPKQAMANSPVIESNEDGINEVHEHKQEDLENQQDDQEEDTEIDVCDNKDTSDSIPDDVNNTEADNQGAKALPSDGIAVAGDDTLTVDLMLDHPLDKYEIIEFVRICLKTVYPMCLYCNHARRIAVNGQRLVLHMIAEHRFTATVDSITAEELQADTIVMKLKSFLPQLQEHYFNSNSYCTYGDGSFTTAFNERIFECFQCRFVAATHKELYLHNRKMHLRTAILCFMCRANFYSFSEILCHICPGAPNEVSVFDVKFRCCLCELDNIPSPFRLMVHLRKKHFACDVCLEDCREQSKLSSHVWKHKLHHLCYRCGIAYRNKQDITKHLFWKHGTESTICKRCLQKKWPHVYHFCIPPQTFTCEVCNLCFSKAMYLRVHKRVHSGDFRYPCAEDDCDEKFVSRRLLLKHAAMHLPPPPLPEPAEIPTENKENMESAVKEETKAESGSGDLKIEVAIKKEPLDEAEVLSQKLKAERTEEKCEKEAEVGEQKALPKEEEDKVVDTPKKKRKKSKRSKGLLEDLNLAAPNLSESDSSDGDDSDSDSKTRSEIDAMPKVMLSPPSEAEGDDGIKTTDNPNEAEPGKVLEIWQNFLKSQKSPPKENDVTPEPKDPSRNVMYGPMHIALSDHDYCKLYEPPPPPPPPPKDTIFKKPEMEIMSTPETSPVKRKQSKSPRRLSSKRSDASSSSSESSSSSDSSCSCGSNCSCSSSNSGSSSSSSSSEESDSSAASNASQRKRHRKKSERDRMRKRSESISPLKQPAKQTSDVISVVDDDAKAKDTEERPPSLPKEPLFYESDLETNESETDEEFYDEHPQKLATELLAQKRALLMAQTRLSPSHNYDIVENSRPSTPSLPDDVATNERTKVKVKKRKRDRKSSCKGQGLHASQAQEATGMENAPAQNIRLVPSTQALTSASPAFAQNHATSLINPLQETPQYGSGYYPTAPPIVYATPTTPITAGGEQTFTPRPLTMPPYGGGVMHHRMSEGSSCSDADASLKRSKRARRPNKFYGYTSDDENFVNAPLLMIGSRAFKPQPPPQLTWRKEDLPTPSKSILNVKNKTHRTPKTPANSSISNLFNTSLNSSSAGKKKPRASMAGGDKSAKKRPYKKKADSKLPPIPTLKIRPSQIGLTTARPSENPPASSSQYNSSDSSSDDDMPEAASTPAPARSFPEPPTNSVAKQLLPSQPPPPPTPQTTAFNHKIPPALLPNPDFATLQYFKANNIRYPIRPPAGARQAREGESVYCYCRCPYDEVSEMIACDGENCLIEWFHFECVGIMVAPQGKWFCAECRPKYSENLYPTTIGGQHGTSH